MGDDKITAGGSKPRTRSPSYPVFGLSEACRRVSILYGQFHEHAVGMEAAAEELDSNTKSSAFLQSIAAMKQFGLLDDDGKGDTRRIRVSKLAVDILVRDPESPERDAAVKLAALRPAIHRELWEKYNGNLPPSDSPIRVYLLREREDGLFHPDHVDGFISQFRATIAFALLTPDYTIPSAHGGEEQAPAPAVVGGYSTMQPPKQTIAVQPQPQPAAQWATQPQPGMRQLPITLPSSLSVAVFTVPVPMSEVDFNTLVSSLTAMKGTLVAKTEPGG